MPDISMCCNRVCFFRNACYRQRAKPSEHRQSWMFFEPSPLTGICRAFMPIWPSAIEQGRITPPEFG